MAKKNPPKDPKSREEKGIDFLVARAVRDTFNPDDLGAMDNEEWFRKARKKLLSPQFWPMIIKGLLHLLDEKVKDCIRSYRGDSKATAKEIEEQFERQAAGESPYIQLSFFRTEKYNLPDGTTKIGSKLTLREIRLVEASLDHSVKDLEFKLNHVRSTRILMERHLMRESDTVEMLIAKYAV